MAKGKSKKAVAKATARKKARTGRKTTSTKRAGSNASLRAELKIMVDEANRRLNSILKYGSQSRALDEAMRTRVKAHKDSGDLFRADFSRTRELNREFARVNAFLSDYTSFARGAEDWTEHLTFDFGGQYSKGYDTSSIHHKRAERVFDLYHRIIEYAGGWDRAVGMFKKGDTKLEYGSDVLINMLYEMTVHGYDNEDILSRAWTMLDAQMDLYKELAEKMRNNVDYGPINKAVNEAAERAWKRSRAERKGKIYTDDDKLWSRR